MDAPGSANGPGGGDPLDRLMGLLELRLEDVRVLVDDAAQRWRGDRIRFGEGTRRRVQDLARELGFVTRDEWDELELRVAQLEHRLRLLERHADERADERT
jgi:polyhydroxyalkanoate synthesis regulator phasin